MMGASVCRSARCARLASLGRRMQHTLPAHELARYREDGWIVPSVSLDKEELEAARRSLGEVLARNPGVPPEQLVNAHLEGHEGQGMGVRGSRGILALASNPKLVDAAAACLGTDDVILWGVQIFCKPAGSGKAVPWHQDGQYWPIEPLRACTLWVALDESTPSNGGLHVISGSHCEGEIPHEAHRNDEAAISVYLTDEALGPARLARSHAVALQPGQVSIHDAMIVHGSKSNRSASRRAGVACHYMPAQSHFRRDLRTFADREGGLNLDYSQRPLVVVKGENRNSANTGLMPLDESLQAREAAAGAVE